MNNSEKRAKAVSASISKVKDELSNFTLTELSIALKRSGCPYCNNVASLLKKKGIVVKNKGLYIFASKEPVYYKTIEKELEDIYRIYCKNQPTIKPVMPSDSFSSKYGFTEKDAIEALKASGYKILKSVINFEEI